MSLVSQVGRKRPRARLAMASLYLLLILGALTTVYPFLLMVSTGLKGPTDQNDTAVIPMYVSDSNELLSKYVDDKYSGNLELIGSTRIGSEGDVAEYEGFLMSLPSDMWMAGFRLAPNQVTSRVTQRYQSWLRSKFASIEELNKAYIEENVAFQTVQPSNGAAGAIYLGATCRPAVCRLAGVQEDASGGVSNSGFERRGYGRNFCGRHTRIESRMSRWNRRDRQRLLSRSQPSRRARLCEAASEEIPERYSGRTLGGVPLRAHAHFCR